MEIEEERSRGKLQLRQAEQELELLKINHSDAYGHKVQELTAIINQLERTIRHN